MVEKVILFGIRFLVYLSDLFCISFGGMHVHAYVFKPKDDNNYIYRSWKVDKIYLFIFSLSTYIYIAYYILYTCCKSGDTRYKAMRCIILGNLPYGFHEYISICHEYRCYFRKNK